MDISLIVVPYDSGQRAYRMGRGPEHLLSGGLADHLRAAGHSVRSTVFETAGDEVTSAFDLAGQISKSTRSAEADGAFPIILAGNCISSLGGLAGFAMRTGLLWLDAHADFNTPETSPSGFLDGMALAVITGRCLGRQAATVPGFEPLADERIVMLGVRSID
ncbi:MAG TPA: arginase family protein, partial [Longimicrobiales bacterium]